MSIDMPDEASTPLIWTIRGNLPVADLLYETHWVDDGAQLRLIETYRDGHEIVRQSVHVYIKPPAPAQS